ncbi:MAG: alpha/beta hydrolase [Gammaproteobacteria bacterium]|nr:alpha/beta hydrolase [Gammaproteobacteria bacterium]MCP4089592.1 alpha/beta hydrolase [Gammaproteobacteria bacterium]MCP4278073.1 alpha/beta hydrolase [Gammaproteobacteria bacterium]MCP4832483.1 alpha/beta hydrolase [Gammaproteobacteria bacterium]MCP4930175.1 alpha/beta hydrolase [Gammaproteobacteria bacterium]
MKFLRIMGKILAGLLLLLVLASLIALYVYRDIPREVLEAKYTNEASQFTEVAGVRIHYRDEGPRDAPAVVLIHANFASLLGWEPWAEALKDKYRVVRLDMTSHGLTGPDPTGDYTLERTMEITEAFIDALGIEKLTIGGTSLGGTVSVFYTMRNPERVNNLILLSPGSVEGKEQQARRGKVPDSAYILKYILPRALPEFMLAPGFGGDEQPPEELITRWHDMWLLEGQREAQLDRLSQYDSGDIGAVFAQVRIPVLLLWGEDNTTAKYEQHEEVIHMLKNAESINFVSYPGVGHMATQQAGAEIAVDVRAFLDGTLNEATLVQ